jgi:AcrR family transcriptional regulator
MTTPNATGPLLRARRPATNRDKILEAFTRMVADRGYSRAAIGDVAAEVGVSKGTILHHFGNKEALLNEMGIAYIERRSVELSHALDRLDDPVDQLSAVVFCTVLGMRDDNAASCAFAREFPLFQSEPGLQPARDRRKAYAQRVERVIAHCMDQGVLRPDDPTIVMLEILGMCNWTWTWYRPSGRLSAEAVAESFVRVLLRGLGPGPAGEPELTINAERIAALLREAPQR